MARIFHRGKGKYKGKLPIICFNCNDVGHIATRCPKKKNKRNGDKYKGKRVESNKDYKKKGKKACYIVEEECNCESNYHDDEVVYVFMKDDSDED